MAGLETSNRLLNPKEREIVVCHEMGQAPAASTRCGRSSERAGALGLEQQAV
jgi:hypothetical protein